MHSTSRYERVAVRIFQDSPPAQREDAAKILGWLACAERLPYWREIQALFCIDPQIGQADYEGERLRLSCKQLCGSLVDIHHVKNGQDGPDDIVKIVHGTAREYVSLLIKIRDGLTNLPSYLIRSGWTNPGLEHAKAATFCFRYLTSAPFLCEESGDQVLQHAKRGYYAFQDYSVQYCLDHFLKSTEPRDPDVTQTTVLNAVKAAGDFLKSYSMPEKLDETYNHFSRGAVTEFIRGLPEDPREREQYFDITCRTAAIRQQIEEVRCGPATTEEKDIINNLYGFQGIFKCPKSWCAHFTAGFDTKMDRTKHINCHERPYYCSEESCFASQFGFEDEDKLKQHVIRHHPPDDASVRFPKMSGRRQGAGKHSGQGDSEPHTDSPEIADFLKIAITQGDMASVLRILASNEEFKDLRARSALILAAEHGQLELCKQLLDGNLKLFEKSPNIADNMINCVSTALVGGHLDIVYLFLCQPELSTDQARRKLPECIATACRHGNPDVIKFLLESQALSTIRTSTFDPDDREKILNACISSASLDTIKYLLECGFSAIVLPDAFFRAEHQGREDLVKFLRPLVDKTHPPYSMQRAESLVAYLGAESLKLDQEQMVNLQNLSPDAQRRKAMQYKNWEWPTF